MKSLALLLFLCVLMLPGCQSKQDDTTAKTETVSIAIPTAVCGMCEKAIQKAVYAVEGVKDVTVDVDAKRTNVTFVSLQTNLAVIERAITEAGYDANDKKRNPDAYDQLPDCCKEDNGTM